MALLLSVIIASYAFYSGIFANLPPVQDANPNYFNMLGEAFLSGHTYIDSYVLDYYHLPPAKNAAISSKPPYFFLDTSFYQGRYYVYWGPVPVLLVWIPIKLLTGISVSAGFTGFIFASLAIACLTLLFFRISQRIGAIPLWGTMFVILSLAYGTWIPFVLRGARFYEVPGLGGYAFTAMGLLCYWLYWENKKSLWLVLASLCFGLAVGCRINLIFNGVFIVLALIILHREHTGRERIRTYIQALFPWLMCLSLYGIYNYVRFDSPFQTGISYQVSVLDWHHRRFRLFTPEWSLEHAYLYLFKPLQWNVPIAFPFFSPASFWGNMTIPWTSIEAPYLEPTFGLLSNSPFALFYFLIGAHWKNRQNWAPSFRLIIYALLLYSATVLLFFMYHYYVTQRYSVDFAPWLMAISGMVYLLSLRACSGKMGCTRALFIFGALFCAYGVFTGTMSGYCGYFRC